MKLFGNGSILIRIQVGVYIATIYTLGLSGFGISSVIVGLRFEDRIYL